MANTTYPKNPQSSRAGSEPNHGLIHGRSG